MARKKDPHAERKARWIDLPDWFLEEMRKAAGGLSAQEVGNRILEMTGKSWTRTVVGDFLDNRRATIEIAEAFCDAYDIPRITWFARTLSEALAFRRESAKHDGPGGDPGSRDRYDKARERLEKELEPQTRVVVSQNEVGVGRGKRTRRVGRSRT